MLGESFNVMNLSKQDLSDKGTLCILYGELFTTYGAVINKVVNQTDTNILNATLSMKNDLLFPSSSTVDALSLISPSAILNEGVILGGDMFVIRVSEKFNNVYLSYLFNNVYKNKLASYGKGSTIVHLHYNDIKDVKIELPALEYQRKVIKVLTSLENKRRIENLLLEELYTQKTYLLHNVFI